MVDAFSEMLQRPIVVDPAKPPRVLVVASTPTAQVIEDLFAQSGVTGAVQVVPDCLAALGQMAVESPGVLICHIDQLDQPMEVTAEAFRKLAPKASMLLVAPNQRRADAGDLMSPAFDQCLFEPVDPARFASFVTSDNPPKPIEQEQALPPNGQSSRRSFNKHGKRTMQSDPLFELNHQLESDAPMRATAVDASGCLEVVDAKMIGRLLACRGGLFGQTVIETMASTINLPGAAWTDQDTEIPPGHVSVTVEHAGQEFGSLHAPPSVRVDQLRPWAVRLGQWLGLADRVDDWWQLAMRDEMTGLWNRRYFNQFLDTVLGQAANERFYVSLLVFDIDDFKSYNDRYGHLAGDDILHETARLMQTLVRDHDVVARIGGDEFAVVFWDAAGPRRANSAHPHDPMAVAQRFQKAIFAARFPKLGHEAPGTLTISGGLAGFPWDGHTPEQLLDRADKMALRSKQQGKNAITFGPGAQRLFDKRST